VNPCYNVYTSTNQHAEGKRFMAKVGLHVTVDEELLEKAKRKREKTGRSISHVVNEAIKRWVGEDRSEQDEEHT
jgi:post-segregation antitoxin (ccd killing protein)